MMQAGLDLRRDEIVGYIKAVLPIVIQQTKVGGWRGTSAVHFAELARWQAERGGSGNKVADRGGRGSRAARRRP
ncbi:hypothetical protein [Lichenifustis flavocetrariae]|uniref:Uncharacterized protein n=1 Tax=Lichenifustis flavocetrariae TaxID=2949735 RepID=A0AA42CJZ8_9HYPH|nr:hypothetical protein [Lichenifustis flavocetrariae]MCW6510039.1 hypothetical protein [Lichenifustis flavocetrariae]